MVRVSEKDPYEDKEREKNAKFKKLPFCKKLILRLFLTVPWVGRQLVIVVFRDHAHLLFVYTTV